MPIERLKRDAGRLALSLRYVAAFSVVTVLLGSTADARQLALIVGISDYSTLPDAAVAVENAKEMAEVLKASDYEVTLVTDVGAAELDAAIAAFQEAAAGEDTENALFYFAGHAFQFEGANRLAPADAVLGDQAAVLLQTRALAGIIDGMATPTGQSFIFIDPAAESPLGAELAAIAGGVGLAKVEPRSGMLIAYSAQPGALPMAPEGDAKTSSFTESLVNRIPEPGSSISDMMVIVRTEVESMTGGFQKPWDVTALRAQYYFEPVYETSANLTAADYEMLAELDPETREKLLALLTGTGVSLEIEALEEAELQLASIEQSLVIEAVDDVGISVTDVTEQTNVDAGQSDAASLSIMAIDEGGEAAEVVVVIEAPETPTVPAADGTESGIVIVQPEEIQPATGTTEVVVAPPGLDAPELAAIAPTGDTSTPVIKDTQAPAIVIAEPEVAPSVEVAAIAPVDQTLAIDTDPAETLAPVEPVLAAVEIPEDLASAVQTELARLGCYRSAIDGDWGKGSALSLVRYYSAKKSAPETLEPTADLYVALRREENVICKLTTTTARIPTTVKPVSTTASSGKRVITTTTTTASGQRKTIKRINSGVFR